MNDFWQLKRKDNAAIIQLPQDMRWSDEFAWAKVAQATPQRTLSGGLVIQQGVKLNGRPITLEGDWVWIERSVIETLRAWSDEPDLTLELTHYDGRVFEVIFRSHDAALGNVNPVRYSTPELSSERYTLSINLMTV